MTEVDQDSELNPSVLKTTTQYLSGFQTKVTNPRGKPTITSYLTYDEPSTAWPVSIVAPGWETTSITRDAFGKPLTLTRSGPFNGTTLSVIRYYIYDANQQLCERIQPESGMTVMDYDDAGNVAWTASGLPYPATPNCDSDRTTAKNSGRRVDRGYDQRNRLSALAFPDGNGDQIWTYTPDGLPSQVDTTNSGNTVTNKYFYDKRRLITREQLIAPLDRLGQISGTFTWTSNYAHDANGHLSSFTNPKGSGIDYAPNALGQPTRAGTYATGVSYFPDGKLKSYTAGNGIMYSMQENTRGLPAEIAYSGAQGQPASFDSLYTYDQDGNVTLISDVARTNYDRSMTYDDLDRLSGVFSGYLGGQYNMTYDVLDNLRVGEHVGGSTNTYNYDSHNRLNTISNTVSGTTSLGWDVQGNLSSKGGSTYQFDYGNRLRQIPGNESYMYDGYGRRIEQVGTTLNSIFKQYTYAGQLDFESDERNGVQQGYVYLGDQLIAIQDYTHNSVRWQTTDALGSVIAQTNSAAWVDHFNYYHIWGNLQTGSLSDDPGYAKLVYDTNTGLSYAQQRYYDPTIPGFLSIDPVDVDTTIGANFNRYWYAKDNPYRYTDPDGRCPKEHPICMEDSSNWYTDTFLGGLVATTFGDPIALFRSDHQNPLSHEVLLPGQLMDAKLGMLTLAIPAGRIEATGLSVAKELGTAISESRALTTYFPAGNGFLGATKRISLDAGTIIDRYGGTSISKFFSPAGTPLAARALPPETAAQQLRSFEVLRPFDVESGRVAPAFNQIGMGIQYRSDLTLDDLLQQGYIREFQP